MLNHTKEKRPVANPLMSYILIAEDERDIQLMLQRKLELSGFGEVRVTADGQEALDMALSDPPRLILLDIMLPNLDGLTICRTVKEQLGEDAPIIVILSARGQQTHIDEGLASGADDYIVKPFSPKDLMATIEPYLM